MFLQIFQCRIFNLFAFIILTTYSWPGVIGAHWDYTGEHGTEHWAKHYPDCGKTRQSPVDVKETTLDRSLPDLGFKNYDEDLQKPELFNNGHTVQMDGSKSKAKIYGGCLNDDKYKLEQLHFHWGSSERNGSEHLFKGVAHPMELHLVHRNTKYSTLMDALQHPDGLAVLAVFFKLREEGNKKLKPIIHNLDKIRYQNKKTSIEDKDFKLYHLLPKDKDQFMCYKGSLTTPTCNEVVTWILFPESVYLGREQLEEFRKTHFGTDSDSRRMVDNFRPVQPLNGRIITFRDSAATRTEALSSCLLLAGVMVSIFKTMGH